MNHTKKMLTVLISLCCSTAVVWAEMPSGVQRLMKAYPGIVTGYENGYLIFKSGRKVLYDDGMKKDFVTMLDNADPEDMMSQVYQTNAKPEYLEDVGRTRSEAFFHAVYGDTEAQLASKLVSVPFCGQTVRFTSTNDANKALEAVSKELMALPDYNSKYKAYCTSSGTFVYRSVRGAKRLSAHSYGIAIDIAVKYSSYWLWNNKGAGELQKITYMNKIPLEIVEIFEKHGFVWGGRWYHYDTMHFEYRPEYFAE